MRRLNLGEQSHPNALTAAVNNIHATNLLRRSNTTSTPANESVRIAAIDVGSNSIHMIVAQIDADGGATTLWRMKEPVGLGRMSFPSRRLSKVAMDGAIAALTRFKVAAQQRQAQRIIAVATSAVREATNGGDLLERAKLEVGINLKVISARDEARLIYVGVRHATSLGNQPHLIVDIGGGSVEFIVGDEKKAAMLESRKLGAARMTAKFVHTDPISASDLAAMKRHYERELSTITTSVATLAPVAAIGTSGTLENIAAMCESLGSPNADVVAANGAVAHSGSIERKKFDELLAILLTSDTKSRGKLRGLDDQRKDQIVAGAVLVGEIFEKLRVNRFAICGSAFREGILIDYLSRHLPDLQVARDVPDPRRRSVLDLARRCDWHQIHSEHVQAIALRLYDTRSLHRLGAVERELIEFASMLHDIGWHIGRTGHHKHSMYLIQHGDLRGFSDEEIDIIANIARYHRKTAPKKKHRAYAALSDRARQIVDVGAAILRLADGLDRSHAGVVTGLHCRVSTDAKDAIRCTLYAKSDAELELWGARRKRKYFEKVFDREIEFAMAASMAASRK